MKNENKCFFSISLENGITITGKNPYEVREFLRTCHLATIYAEEVSKKEYPYSTKVYAKLGANLINAIVTINESLED